MLMRVAWKTCSDRLCGDFGATCRVNPGLVLDNVAEAMQESFHERSSTVWEAKEPILGSR